MPLYNINTIQISDRDATDLDRTNSKDNLYNSKYDDIVNKHKESNPMYQTSTKYVINKPYENKLQELIYDNGSTLRDAIDEAIERNQRIKENDDRILERISNSQDNKSKTNQIKDANKAYHNKPKYVLKNPYENITQEIIYDKNILSNTINTAINKE